MYLKTGYRKMQTESQEIALAFFYAKKQNMEDKNYGL